MTQHDNPYAHLPEVPGFSLVSDTIADGQPLATAQYSGAFGVPGGQDISPQLSWAGAPEETKSYAVTAYDPDAPTGSGFWHWAVADIPAAVTSLPAGAGAANSSTIPVGAFQLPNDARLPQFIGAAPPAGHGAHRYCFTVHALDVDHIEVRADSTPAYLGFVMASHILGRATLIATAEISADA